MSKKNTAEAKTEKTTTTLIERGKLVRETAAKGVDLKEFTDVVQEQFPVCGDAWCAKHYKRALARIAKKTAVQKPAAAAPAPVETKPTPKGKKKAVAKA